MTGHEFHLAAAGGGSGGFGGGGEGGGGRGAGLYILIQVLIRIAIFGHGIGALVLIGLVILAAVFLKVTPHGKRWFAAYQNAGPAARRRTHQRERRVELAAAEAAEDDPAFAPDIVRRQATRLFERIQRSRRLASVQNSRMRTVSLSRPERLRRRPYASST